MGEDQQSTKGLDHPEPFLDRTQKEVDDKIRLKKKTQFQRKKAFGPTIDELYEGIVAKNRSLLARAITLIESNSEQHFLMAQDLLQRLLPFTGHSVRIGITGVPGAGKSTFIEAFGTYLCNQGHHVAVLAIDPSSTLNGGSILGDKTRMENLARHPLAFIRPSPSGGQLGGVHRKTREAMFLCEAAGFDIILIETVGVGQSEVMIRDMVDFFLLLVLTGAGDELQGMKKGIMELADAIIVHKADGLNMEAAIQTMGEYNRILHFLQAATNGWKTKANTCSSITMEGIDEIWENICGFQKLCTLSGVWEERRKAQSREWFYSLISEQLHYKFFHHPIIKDLLPKLENEVMAGDKTAALAVEHLFKEFFLGFE